ncbi:MULTISPECIES: hypothetical protein [Aerococcus]|uniref:Lipoprotein n=1 Tax=Aerococcus sanguinicola TaxID=119206 RepID=A0A5N1GL70_9LACT|nr:MULTISPECIES: hypothetical protein [Aerococcus]KAA9301723.1 hypothetical protein F6I03_00505 [Aerococcus sanguinicola]MDK6368864.1 hypothetical protein [Aerococcus sp. UMB9870]MDK6685693.1 hypothetical protein [Aerococcus sp. UMB8623]
MWKKLVNSLSLFSLSLVLFACGRSDQSLTFAGDQEKSSAQTVQASKGGASQSEEASDQADPADQGDDDKEESAGQSSDQASSQGTSAKASESSSDQALASNTESNPDSSKDLLPKVSSLIHQASANIYNNEDYYFMPSVLEDGSFQVEVRRQAPENMQQSNLVTIYRYQPNTGQLLQQDILTNTWNDVTP